MAAWDPVIRRALRLSRRVYGRRQLAEAAADLGAAARVSLSREGDDFLVRVEPAASGADPRALERRFLELALDAAYRAAALRFQGELAAGALEAACQRARLHEPPDPLEQLEPQVREDRRRDVAALLERAAGLEGRCRG